MACGDPSSYGAIFSRDWVILKPLPVGDQAKGFVIFVSGKWVNQTGFGDLSFESVGIQEVYADLFSDDRANLEECGDVFPEMRGCFVAFAEVGLVPLQEQETQVVSILI